MSLDFSVRWTGYLEVDKPGPYFFRIEGPGPVLVQVGKQDAVNTGTGRKTGALDLTPGWHPIDVWYRRGKPNLPMRVELYWRPPGRPQAEIIPYQNLRPAAAYPPPPDEFATEPPGI